MSVVRAMSYAVRCSQTCHFLAGGPLWLPGRPATLTTPGKRLIAEVPGSCCKGRWGEWRRQATGEVGMLCGGVAWTALPASLCPRYSASTDATISPSHSLVQESPSPHLHRSPIYPYLLSVFSQSSDLFPAACISSDISKPLKEPR